MFGKLKATLFGTRFSDQTAKNRLQMVLVHDRSGLSPKEMDLFQKDLMGVISKYFVLEKNAIEIEWQRNDATVALVINTPVVGRTLGAAKSQAKQATDVQTPKAASA